MVKWLATLILLSSLAAYASGDRPAKIEEIKAIKSKIINRLKDPESAKITDVRVKGGEIKDVCGMINAKNSYGGYTGKSPFYGLLSGQGNSLVFVVIGIGETDAEAEVILETCREKFKS